MQYQLEMETPIGAITVVSDYHYIIRLDFGKQEADENVKFITSELLDGPDAPTVLLEAKRQLDEYFSGQRFAFDLPLELHGTAFQEQCWRALAEIPYGTTCSYKALAERVGRPKAFRAVGQCNHRNPIAIILPCHRVIGADGGLCGFGGGLTVKEQLLALERRFIDRPAMGRG